jgi:hypothetical protein
MSRQAAGPWCPAPLQLGAALGMVLLIFLRTFVGRGLLEGSGCENLNLPLGG